SYVQIAIGLHRAEFLLKPGSTYVVELSVQHYEYTSYYDAEALEIKVLESTDGGLSIQANDVNFKYNAFVMKHFNDLYRFQRVALFDTLQNLVNASISNPADPYITSYAAYKLASLDAVLRKLTAQQMYDRYFKDKPALYSNPEYIGLLKETFEGYISDNKRFTFEGLVISMLDGKKSFDDYISVDPILQKDQRFRELLELFYFKNNYYNASIPSGLIIQMLQDFSKSANFAEHRTIAANILAKHQQLAYNTLAPQFNLADGQGKRYSLSDFNQLLLISFVRKDCKVCELRLLELKNIYELYKLDYQFVTIVDKEAFPYYQRLFRQNKIDWPLLNLGENIELLEAYQVKAFPELILLLPGGKIGMAPAPPVDQNLEYHMNRLRSQQKK
ncbi:MAG: redoxin domain-containing protein, partial [Ignavibacteria bacterium]|nr:redoxin domain-containing protein [Ignavibacteria bacterium]